MPSSPTGILVLGAGELGNAILKALAKSRQREETSISVLLRPATIATQVPGKRAEVGSLRDLGISLVPGDILEDPSSTLSTIFAQYDTIIGCFGMFGPPGTQIKIGKAVLDAKVRKYIPWQFGVDYDSITYGTAGGLFDEQMDIRKLLRGQNSTKWIIISTGMFMSFIYDSAFGIVSEDKSVVHALGSWDNRVTLTDVADIGAVTAEVVFDRPEIVDQVVFCAGETIQYRKIPEVLKAIGFDVKIEQEWNLEKLRQDLSEDPENKIKKYRVVFAEGQGLSWNDDKTYNVAKGMEMIKLVHWSERNIKT